MTHSSCKMAGPLRPVQRHQHLLVTLLLVLPVPGELDVGHCDRQDECAAAIRTIRKLESERVGFGKKRKRGREDVMVRIRPGWTCPAKVPHWLQRFLDCWHGAHQQRSAITAKKLKRYSFGHAQRHILQRLCGRAKRAPQHALPVNLRHCVVRLAPAQ